MRRFSLTGLVIALTFAFSLIASSGAGAVVVKMGAAGKTGVALVPGSSTVGLPLVSSSGACKDPWLAPDLGGPNLSPVGLCFNGGDVVTQNETFAITWDAPQNSQDPVHSYWATTRDFVEQFMKNVADGSGTLSSPYALTTQYNGSNGRAANQSKYGGGCIDYGVPAPCLIGTTQAQLPGLKYPSSGCSVSGGSWIWPGNTPNTTCLTDAQLQPELKEMISRLQTGGNVAHGYTPMLVLLTPPGVEVCLDGAGTLCSANSSAAASTFCSYHGEVPGTNFVYVVQPWVPHTGCDEPNLPKLPDSPTTIELATDAGIRLVNPLSQGEISAIVNPHMAAWYGTSGAEVSDNGCQPNGPDFDTVHVGSGNYVIQREFNNGGVIVSDPNALECAPFVDLAPTFVVPSAAEAGDVVTFDGSTTNSTLVVPSAKYQWNFGDGTKAAGPSVSHSYDKSGVYNVTLDVTDRGGNKASFTAPMTVLGSGGSVPHGGNNRGGLKVQVQLVPQSLQKMLRSGVAVRVTSNTPANGIASLSISRKAARRAHIKGAHGPSVVIARGTISEIKSGTVKLRLHMRLTGSTARKLRHLQHLTVTLRMALVGSNGGRVTVDAAGRY